MEAVKLLEPHERLTSDDDAEADVLYLSVGAPRPAEGIDVGDGIVLRYDAEQRAVVGLTVIGLRHRLLRELGHSEHGAS